MEVLELVPQNLIDFVIKKNSEWFNTSVRWTDSQKFHHLFCLLLRDPTLKSKMNSLIMTGYNPYKIMLFTLWLVNLYYNIQKHTRENSDIDNKKRVNEINSFVKDNCTTDEALLISILISTYTPAKLSRNLDDVIVKPNQEKTHKSKSSKDATTSHLYRGKDHAILFDILNDVIILNTISVDNFNKEIQEFINGPRAKSHQSYVSGSVLIEEKNGLAYFVWSEFFKELKRTGWTMKSDKTLDFVKRNFKAVYKQKRYPKPENQEKPNPNVWAVEINIDQFKKEKPPEEIMQIPEEDIA